MKLKQFQEEIYKSLKKSYKENDNLRTYLHMPTGSGKTVVASMFILNEYISKGGHVLWITDSWALINQAYKTIKSISGETLCDDLDFGLWIKYLSKKNHEIANNLDSFKRDYIVDNMDWIPKFLFSTNSTLSRSCENKSSKEYEKIIHFKPSIIVVDEAHRGKGGKQEVEIYELLNGPWKNVPVLGLSATPKLREINGWDSRMKVGNYSFRDLVEMGELAEPILLKRKIQESVEYKQDRNGFLNEEELADDKVRNDSIIEDYLRNKKNYRKTMIFVTNQIQASYFAKELSHHGVECYLIHGKVKNPYRVLKKFKESKGHDCIAIVIRMAICGVDIPDINTIILAKPVTSDIEFSQMIGRGSRMHTDTGKKTFNVVDFYGSLERESHSLSLTHFVDFYNGSGRNSELVSKGALRKKKVQYTKHEYIDGYGLTTLNYEESSKYFEALDGLRIYNGQTFGIEIELSTGEVDVHDISHDEWTAIANQIIKKIMDGTNYINFDPISEYSELGNINHDVWNIVYDGSCGFEIVSRILKGQEGFEELVNVVGLLNSEFLGELGLKIDYSTGLHLNLGWRDFSKSSVLNMINYMRNIEPALNSLVSPSRVIVNDKASFYCKSLRSIFDSKDLKETSYNKLLTKIDSDDGRYMSFNLQNRDGDGQRVEVRLHNGTISTKKISLWTSLFMNIFVTINSRHTIPLKEDLDFPSEIGLPQIGTHGDILYIAEEYLGLSSNQKLLNKLNQRRRELLNSSAWREILGDEVIDELLRYWDSSKSIVNLNEVREYSNISLYDKNRILTKLIKTNELKIHPSKLDERIFRSKLFCIIEDEDILCAGVKEDSPKLLSAILNYFEKKISQCNDSFITTFIDDIKNNNAFERGWSMNASRSNDINKERWRKINLRVDQLLREEKYATASIFSSVSIDNKKGMQYLKEQGFLEIMTIPSPWNKNKKLKILLKKNQ
ncbi:DEAD/DEAH box helicase family protein [Halobacteriovorax sp. HLS]|uniref:DEAD/DEAH box helicase family protein n=1 Tax=Halobacteriovorax sp. HLS TaxID=2234000 RepID=UPI000FD8E7AE|nr:DEAD/DEAH box helicase family protein [Halobacteriovorax sp. HLS]